MSFIRKLVTTNIFNLKKYYLFKYVVYFKYIDSESSRDLKEQLC